MTLFAFLEVKTAFLTAIAAIGAALLFARGGTHVSTVGTSLYLSNGAEVNATRFVSVVNMLGGGSALANDVRPTTADTTQRLGIA